MSGPENLRGIDYQISFSLLKILTLIRDDFTRVNSIKFESLNEEEEDLNIFWNDGNADYIQIKKKMEGYHWVPSEIKYILEGFFKKDNPNVRFSFITNGGGNVSVRDLKNALRKETQLSDELLLEFTTKILDIPRLRDLLKKTSIMTNAYAYYDDDNPGFLIREEICRILNNTPFFVSDDINKAINTLWMHIFDLAKNSSEISVNELVKFLASIEIKCQEYSWFKIPDLSGFRGRQDEIENINEKLQYSRIIIITGISGIGKTSLTSKLAATLHEQRIMTCWTSVNHLTTKDEIVFNIVSLLNLQGLYSLSQAIIKAEPAYKVAKIIDVLIKQPFYLFFDNLNAGSLDVNDFVEEILKETLEKKLTGAIFISSTDIPKGYTDIDVITKKVSEYQLAGFTLEDTEIILKELRPEVSSSEVNAFHKATGGHPISIVFLKQLLDSEDISRKDVEQLKTLSIENSRKWLFDRVFSILPPTEQEALLSLSIFEYPFTEIEAEQILKVPIRLTYLLFSLKKKNIITIIQDQYYIHDSIRSLVSDMQPKNSKGIAHFKMAKYYRTFLEKEYVSKGEVLYEDIHKWGYHLEHVDTENLMPEQKRLLELDNQYLDALWAIQRFGYPFAFSDPTLKQTKPVVRYLLDNSFICKNKDKSKQYMGTMSKYILINTDFFDLGILQHLCISRGLSSHLGYIKTFEPNYACEVQGIMCPWEHCIEYYPLPPMTKDQYADRIKFLKEMFAKGAYDDKPEDIRSSFLAEIEQGIPEDAPEIPDTELVESSCPIFGHCCPAGKDQALACRSDDETLYE